MRSKKWSSQPTIVRTTLLKSIRAKKLRLFAFSCFLRSFKIHLTSPLADLEIKGTHVCLITVCDSLNKLFRSFKSQLPSRSVSHKLTEHLLGLSLSSCSCALASSENRLKKTSEALCTLIIPPAVHRLMLE